MATRHDDTGDCLLTRVSAVPTMQRDCVPICVKAPYLARSECVAALRRHRGAEADARQFASVWGASAASTSSALLALSMSTFSTAYAESAVAGHWTTMTETLSFPPDSIALPTSRVAAVCAPHHALASQ
eukprot:5036152-Pleurochrysis_carterae.AAC.1